MRSPRQLIATATICLLLLPTQYAHAQAPPQRHEFGDAPGGGPAYPTGGVVGQFPTCLASPFGYIKHTNNVPILYWGPGVDFEFDGNAGLCQWPPYDSDECSGPQDLDAGLITPDAFTMTGGIAVSCVAPQAGRSLGPACGIASWGSLGNIDLTLHNLTGATAWVNILFDWNQDGQWSGSSGCGAGTTPEWVVQNLIIPMGFSGPISLLFPPPFQIGPNSGYVWARFTVHDGPPIIALDWDGSGTFDSGETEDYLLRIDPGGTLGEYGDAPDGVLAYPPGGVIGQFPTCNNTPGHVFHSMAAGSPIYFGPTLDAELDGNHSDCGFNPYDNDECGPGDGDAGLITPGSYTINATGNYVLCANSGSGTIGNACDAGRWGHSLDITAVNSNPSTAYLQVLADWSHDGRWDTNTTTCPGGGTFTEQVLTNLPVPSGFSGPISGITPNKFQIGGEGYVWFRFTISSSQVPAGWDGSGSFPDGETEDYLLYVAPAGTGVTPQNATLGFAIERAEPNPFGNATVIAYSMRDAGPVRLWITDLAGRRIASLFDGPGAAGRNSVRWDGRRDDGRMAGPGVYYVRGESGDETRSLKLTRVR